MTTVSDLIAALPETEADEPSIDSIAAAARPLAALSQQPVPIGRFQRFTALGTLQAKIGAAYLFRWLRGWFAGAEQNQRLLAEAHWRTALRVLDSMTVHVRSDRPTWTGTACARSSRTT